MSLAPFVFSSRIIVLLLLGCFVLFNKIDITKISIFKLSVLGTEFSMSN